MHPVMKRFGFFELLLSLALLTAGGCYYDVEEELYPSEECDTANVTYSADISPAIQNNCLVCHSNAARLGNITLEGYDNLKAQVNNGRLLGAIKHQPGFAPMPDGLPQLDACLIARIEQWITDGAPNN